MDTTILVLAVIILLSPLIFAILITLDLTVEAKIVVGAACLFLLILLPLLAFWLGL